MQTAIRVEGWAHQLLNRTPAHLTEYGCELFGSFFNFFVGLSMVTLNFGTGWTEHWIPSPSVRLLINGLVYAGSGSLFAISPLGKLSGAHINPSMSLAMFFRGKMHFRDLVGYVVAQMIGETLGAALLVLVWGKYAANIQNGMTLPASGVPIWIPFLAEMLLTFALVFGVFLFTDHQFLIKWTPLMAWILIAVMVWQEAPLSGTSLNPARSFGPALVSWNWEYHWLYWIAPLSGASLAALLYQWTSDGSSHRSGKLCHASKYRSIFKLEGMR
jgi:aquaporin Z